VDDIDGGAHSEDGQCDATAGAGAVGENAGVVDQHAGDASGGVNGVDVRRSSSSGAPIFAPSTTAKTAALSAPPQYLSALALDTNHLFPAGKVVPVSGNTHRMLQQTRYWAHFQFYGGDFSRHFGPFEADGKKNCGAL
jgi:hypothetical protein